MKKKAKRIIAFWLAVALLAQQFMFPASGIIFAGQDNFLPTLTPTIYYEGIPIYDGIQLPPDAELIARFTFTASPGTPINKNISIPAPLIPQADSVPVWLIDPLGEYMQITTLTLSDEGMTTLAITLPETQTDIPFIPFPPIGEPDEGEPENSNEFEDDEEPDDIDESKNDKEPEDDGTINGTPENEYDPNGNENPTDDDSANDNFNNNGPINDNPINSDPVDDETGLYIGAVYGMIELMDDDTGDYTVLFEIPVGFCGDYLYWLFDDGQDTVMLNSGSTGITVKIVDIAAPAGFAVPMAASGADFESTITSITLTQGPAGTTPVTPGQTIPSTQVFSLKYEFVGDIDDLDFEGQSFNIPIPDGLSFPLEAALQANNGMAPDGRILVVAGTVYEFARLRFENNQLEIYFDDELSWWTRITSLDLEFKSGDFTLHGYRLFDINSGPPQNTHVNHTISHLRLSPSSITFQTNNPANRAWQRPTFDHTRPNSNYNPTADYIWTWHATYTPVGDFAELGNPASGPVLTAAGEVRTIAINVQEGTKIVPDSVRIYRNMPDFNVNITTEVGSRLTVTDTGITLTINADAHNIPMRIMYDTELLPGWFPFPDNNNAVTGITNTGSVSFNAESLVPNRATPQTANAQDTASLAAGSFQWVQKGIVSGNPVTPSIREIVWELNVNTYGQRMQNLTVFDRISHPTTPSVLTLNPSSIRISVDGGNTWVNPNDNTNDYILSVLNQQPTGATFSILLYGTSGTLHREYKIQYTTDIAVTVFEGGGMPTAQQIENHAWLSFGWHNGTGYGPGTLFTPPAGWITRPQPSGMFIEKSASYNDATRVITWTVQVNRSNLDVTGTGTVELEIGPDQMFIGGSLNRSGPNGNITSSHPNHLLSPDNGNNRKITVTLDNFNNRAIVFTYQTLVTNPNHFANNAGNQTYRNYARFWGTVNTVGSGSQTLTGVEASAPATVASTVLSSGTQFNPHFYYENGQPHLIWRVRVNQRAQAATYTSTDAELVIVLYYGLSYVPDSARIVGGADPLDAEETLNTRNTLRIDLPDNTGGSGEVIIEYRTSIDVNHPYLTGFRNNTNESTDQTFTNNTTLHHTVTARAPNAERYYLTGGSAEISTPYVPTTQSFRSTLMHKSGVHNAPEDSITYTVFINPNRITLGTGNLLISDIMPDALTLDMMSVRLYNATVNPDGTWNGTRVFTGIDANHDNVIFDNQGRGFSIRLPHDNTPYVLVYTAFFERTASPTITNNIRFGGLQLGVAGTPTAGGGNVGGTVSGLPVLVGNAHGQGNASSNQVRLNVTLHDELRRNIPLNNVTFDLYAVVRGTRIPLHTGVTANITQNGAREGFVSFFPVPARTDLVLVQRNEFNGYTSNTIAFNDAPIAPTIARSGDVRGHTGGVTQPSIYQTQGEVSFHLLRRDNCPNNFVYDLPLTNHPVTANVQIEKYSTVVGTVTEYNNDTLYILMRDEAVNYERFAPIDPATGIATLEDVPHGTYTLSMRRRTAPDTPPNPPVTAISNLIFHYQPRLNTTVLRITENGSILVGAAPGAIPALSPHQVVSDGITGASGRLRITETNVDTKETLDNPIFELNTPLGIIPHITPNGTENIQFPALDGMAFISIESTLQRAGFYRPLAHPSGTIELLGDYHDIDWYSYPHAASFTVNLEHATNGPLTGTQVRLYRTSDITNNSDFITLTVPAGGNSVTFEKLELDYDANETHEWNEEPPLKDTTFYIMVIPPGGQRLQSGITMPIAAPFEFGNRDIDNNADRKDFRHSHEEITFGEIILENIPPPPANDNNSGNNNQGSNNQGNNNQTGGGGWWFSPPIGSLTNPPVPPAPPTPPTTPTVQEIFEGTFDDVLEALPDDVLEMLFGLLTDSDMLEMIIELDYDLLDEILTEIITEMIADLVYDVPPGLENLSLDALLTLLEEIWNEPAYLPAIEVPYADETAINPSPHNQATIDYVEALRASNPDLAPGELPEGFTAVRLQDGSEGDYIIYIIYDENGEPVGYIIVPYGQVFGMLQFFDHFVPFEKTNPQTDAQNIGVKPLIWHMALLSFAITASAAVIKRKRRRKPAA